MFDLEFNSGESAFVGELKISRTYANLLVGNPTNAVNRGIIERVYNSFQKISVVKPFLIDPIIKLEPHKGVSIPFLPECILACNIYHNRELIMLPVIWFDDLDEDSSLSKIFSRSKITEINFMALAKAYEL